MILIATVTILLTMVLITVVYYDLFRRQVLEDLKSYGLLLSNCSSVEEIEQSGVPVESDLRLTIIGSDGRVLYDNEADSVIQVHFLLCHPACRWQYLTSVQRCQEYLQHFQPGAAYDGWYFHSAADLVHGGGQSADREADRPH